MGCWNETCMLSRLPIFHGDDACLVLIAARPRFETGCRPDGAYVPVTTLFRGQYDDYGRLQDPQAPPEAWKLLRECRFVVPRDGDYVPFHMDAGTDGELLGELTDTARDGDLFIASQTNPPRQAIPVLMHACLVDDALKFVQDGPEWDETVRSTTLRVRLLDPIRSALRDTASFRNASILPALKELLRLQHWMDLARLAWSPTSGSGSQQGTEGPVMDLHVRTCRMALRQSARYSEYEPSADASALMDASLAFLLDAAIEIVSAMPDPDPDLVKLVADYTDGKPPRPGPLLRAIEKQAPATLAGRRAKTAAMRSAAALREKLLSDCAVRADLLAMDIVQEAVSWSPTPMLDSLDGLSFALRSAAHGPWDPKGLRRAAETCLSALSAALTDVHAPQALLEAAAAIHSGLEAALA